VEVTEARVFDPPPTLILGVGGGDRERFGWLVEKCAELGVGEIIPLLTERTVHVANRVRAEQTDKLLRRGLEAIKQSGNPFAPRVHAPAPLAEFVELTRTPVRLLAEQGGEPIGPLPSGEAVTCAIGPEGGWVVAEIALMDEAGFRKVSLGDFTLRFETAAVAAVVSVGLARHRNSRGG
jgi:16S rRNA (uracil1498-N3)-methyltransferase